MICLSITAMVASAQEPAATADDSSEGTAAETRFQPIADQAAGRYEFIIDDDQPATLVKQPLLRWSNPVGGDWDGRVYLWTVAGRPAVIASIYKAYHREGQPVTHEFHALTELPLRADRDGQEVWRIESGAVTWKPIPEKVQVDESPRRSSIQMRALARKFSATKRQRDGTLRRLRLLSEPVYRYRTQTPVVADAGLFVFAQTTDPEVLLLIEARATPAGPRWHYALAKLNSVEFRVQFADQEVWSTPEIPWSATRDREAAYTVFFQQ